MAAAAFASGLVAGGDDRSLGSAGHAVTSASIPSVRGHSGIEQRYPVRVGRVA